MLKEFVLFLIKELSEDPDSVVIDEQREDNKAVFSVSVTERDFGRIIGKGGQTIRAIRSLVAAVNREKDNLKEVSVLIKK